MAPKKTALIVNAPAAPVTPTATPPTSSKASSSNNPFTIFGHVWRNYLQSTPQRTKLIDTFLGFLVVAGVLQFVYCVIAGNYVRLPATNTLSPVGISQLNFVLIPCNKQPFNAFLAGFSATVGQFVLTGKKQCPLFCTILASLLTTIQHLYAYSPTQQTRVNFPAFLLNGLASSPIAGLCSLIPRELRLRLFYNRAFADFVFGSVLLHLFCTNFIN